MENEPSRTVTWSFDELQPASEMFELGAARRTDPYYSMAWGYPSAVDWLPTERAHRAFPTRASRHMQTLDLDEAMTHLLDAGSRTTRHSVDVHTSLLGTVHGWKTCTSEQAAALTGRPGPLVW